MYGLCQAGRFARAAIRRARAGPSGHSAKKRARSGRDATAGSGVEARSATASHASPTRRNRTSTQKSIAG